MDRENRVSPFFEPSGGPYGADPYSENTLREVAEGGINPECSTGLIEIVGLRLGALDI